MTLHEVGETADAYLFVGLITIPIIRLIEMIQCDDLVLQRQHNLLHSIAHREHPRISIGAMGARLAQAP